jgi:TRAP-type C4-dicarboxylate transport system permease small subunit
MASPRVLEVFRLTVRQPVESAICGLLIALTAVVVSQVVARYVLEAPLSWSEELARFLLLWLSMLSAAYAFKTGAHFALRILVMQLPEALRRAVALLVHIVVALFFAILLYYSVVFVAGVSGHRAPALQIPMELPYASVVVGTALMLFEVVRSAWREMTGRTVVEAETER